MENEEIMRNNITGIEAAYALNMCTVSISQIIDYNDAYILEQEYDAILNNLNLEKIRKHDALLNTFVEMLNTISFFRIQEMKKNMIEKQYQQKMKSAIWSAIPNIGVIVAGGNPALIVYSLASQIGTGYMNYRKERATAMTEREKAEMELQITAIEQFHALRRELFVTSWKLSEDYNIKDEWRLTEKQIKQYNEILMDSNEMRKYERLESIQDKFEAYPPFWYFLGHAANYIACNSDTDFSQGVREKYKKLAKKHFEKFEECNRYNILREDQLTSSFALEYVDLLLTDETPDYEKIKGLIKTAVNMSGNGNDILELCAVGYLKIGENAEAAKLLKILVNEGYNAETNAKLLSRLYVSGYLNSGDIDYKDNYEILASRISSAILFPMPQGIEEDQLLQERFVKGQIEVLSHYAEEVIETFAFKYNMAFNQVLPVPDERKQYGESYFREGNGSRYIEIKKLLDGNETKREEYIKRLADRKLRSAYLKVLNGMLDALDGLKLYSSMEKKAGLIRQIEQNVRSHKVTMHEIQKAIDERTFSDKDFDKLRTDFSFQSLTDNFFISLKKQLFQEIQSLSSLEELSKVEDELQTFYRNEKLDSYNQNNKGRHIFSERIGKEEYLKDSLLGYGMEEESQQKKKMDLMIKAIKEANVFVSKAENVKILLRDTAEITGYINSYKLENLSDIIAVIEDEKYQNMVFGWAGLIIVEKKKSWGKQNKWIPYDVVEISHDVLECGKMKYSNSNIDIKKLYRLICDLKDIKGE